MTAMKLSQAGVALLLRLEGNKLKAYPDSKGVWTIAGGVTFYPDGSPVKQGDVITAARAAAITQYAINRFVVALNKIITTPLTQNQFDALVLFVYNIGTTSFLNGSVDDKINARQFKAATDTWKTYCNIRSPITGKLVPIDGLVNRRAAEIKLFNTP